MNSQIKAVILDFDDTLCLTEENCFYLENDVLQRMGRSPMARELHRRTWGKPLFEIMPVRSPGIDMEQFRAIYAPLIHEYIADGRMDTVPTQNVKALEALAERGLTLLLLTGREHDEFSHVLEPTHVLAEHIETFYYMDNMQYHKPDPRAFEHIEREHGWRPEECVYVGDSVSDAAAAKGAGLHFIASLESKLRSKDDFEGYPVDVFINAFPEIVIAIEQMEAETVS